LQLLSTLLTLLIDVMRFLRLYPRSPTALAVEHLFLRKQHEKAQEERRSKP